MRVVHNQSALDSAFDGVSLEDAIAVRALAVLMEMRTVLTEHLCG